MTSRHGVVTVYTVDLFVYVFQTSASAQHAMNQRALLDALRIRQARFVRRGNVVVVLFAASGDLEEFAAAKAALSSAAASPNEA